MRSGGRKSGSDSAPKGAPAAASYSDAQPLNLGAALKACDEHDLVRKGTSRRGRYLMVLPLHLSIEQGGNLGTFTQMDTAHPKLVIPTADGHLELEGSFVNTSTSYLVCNCQPRKDHSTCEHVFNQLLVFSDPVLNTNPMTITTTTTAKQEAAAAAAAPNGENEDGGAEGKEKEVAPLAPFYGVSDRPPIKVAKRRSSAGASQSAKKRKRSYSSGTSDEENDEEEEEEATTATTKRKPKRRGSDDDDDNEEDVDTSDEDAYVDKSFKATLKAGAPRRQSLRAVKVIDYSAFDVSDEEVEEVDNEEEEEEEVGGEEEEDDDDDQADVEEVVQLDVSSDES